MFHLNIKKITCCILLLMLGTLFGCAHREEPDQQAAYLEASHQIKLKYCKDFLECTAHLSYPIPLGLSVVELVTAPEFKARVISLYDYVVQQEALDARYGITTPVLAEEYVQHISNLVRLILYSENYLDTPCEEYSLKAFDHELPLEKIGLSPEEVDTLRSAEQGLTHPLYAEVFAVSLTQKSCQDTIDSFEEPMTRASSGGH